MSSGAEPLSDQRVVITGGSGGIGRATAVAFARAGADVLVQYRRDERAATEGVDAIRRLGRRARAVAADVGEEAGRTALLEAAWQWSERIDAWINLAGVDVLTGETRSATFTEKLDLLWRVDVRGTILLCRDVARRMAAQPPGAVRPSILLTGWDQAPRGMEGDAGQMFGTVKSAVMAFSNSFARSVGSGVRVNCLAPGWIRTAWGETSAAPYWDQRARSESVAGRWGTPEDVAAAAVFLCSPSADFIHGQTLEVNGGWQPAVDRQ